ncbi:Restriction enzyme BgcI subunit beta [Haemophilus influenzae]|uniref:restriction endonuclease subunit S n=1 Tax=Haemophilus influenzae TaxID=727 RepID=UPI000D4AD72C|nr:restriction endonuclease subunit S [Haemophilus influenzae]PRM16186.1 Restriction enzyme BgcI subunit beta [Haemophilus influenzae]
MASGGIFEDCKISDVFIVSTPKKKFDANKITFGGKYPYVARGDKNNGIRGYISESEEYLNNGNTISFGQDTATMFYQKDAYFTGDKIKIFTEKFGKLNDKNAQYLLSTMKKSFSLFSWGSSSFNEDILNNTIFTLPFIKNEIAFTYMGDFITELQAERLQELQAERLQELQGYLKVTGLSNYTLTDEEQRAIDDLDNIKWGTFNSEKLFGKATRGKRLKSADRISGDLPFVTAGENDTGISAFIGNDVEVFKANTITIDMFGSAKYRNYQYGADDHIAVVHCDKLAKEAVCFLTSAIHKVSNAGQFSYAKNFYAKDADELNISLPTKNNIPDYALMKTLGSAIQKLVIADVVKYADRELSAYQSVISE